MKTLTKQLKPHNYFVAETEERKGQKSKLTLEQGENLVEVRVAGRRIGDCVVETLREDVEITVISAILQNLNEVVAYGNKLIHVEVSRRIGSHLCGRRRRRRFFSFVRNWSSFEWEGNTFF